VRILVAEDDPVVGDAFEESLRAGHNTVFRTEGVDDTVGRLGDGEVEVAILDVQLRDGTAWEVLDRISSPHPPFRVALVTAVDAAAPQRWAHMPLYRKPLDHQGLMRAVTEAVPYEWAGSEDEGESRSPNWLERLLLADEPPLVVSVPVGLIALALVTLLMIPIREDVFGAIGASYTVAVLLIAAYAGITVGLAGALIAFLAYNFFTVPPYYTFEIASPSHVLELFAFLAAAAVGAVLIGTGRKLSRRQTSEAALSRLRLRLLSQTVDMPSSQLIDVITRVIREALPDGTQLELVQPATDPPAWTPVVSADIARVEGRTVETRSGNRPVLILPVDTEGLLLVASTAGTRITDQDRRVLSFAASELSRVSEQVELLKAAEAAERLQARDEAKNALLAAVSHDLRTPLASMKVAVTTVLEPTLNLSDAQRRRLLDTVNSEVDRLGGMIDHLLDLSRLESGAFRLSQEQVDLTLLVHDAADRVRLASGRKIQIDSTGDAGVVGDQVRLLEVVTNLIDNAARYSTPGTPILVTIRHERGSVIVAVTDNGPGMTREEQETLFRPFTRGTRSGTGSGLGLAITRSIVTAHGGTIEVVSAPGAGTTMSVSIPKRALHA
jgi:two-component system, OmpR family, sensor histidine kinase KdpD